jgi:hypothetical protein
MNPSLDAQLQAARDREVPWNAQRAARIAQRITVDRERSRLGSTIVSLAVGGLASAALCASLVQVSQAIGEGSPSERSGVVEASRGDAPDAQAEVEAVLVEGPVGDGGGQVSTN